MLLIHPGLTDTVPSSFADLYSHLEVTVQLSTVHCLTGYSHFAPDIQNNLVGIPYKFVVAPLYSAL